MWQVYFQKRYALSVLSVGTVQATNERIYVYIKHRTNESLRSLQSIAATQVDRKGQVDHKGPQGSG